MRVAPKLVWSILPPITGLLVPSFVLIALGDDVERLRLRTAVLNVVSREFAEGENVFL
jgi:hypothetical protein